MNSIFNHEKQNEIRQRLEKLNHSTQPLWGKMNASQMLAHCARAMQMPVGDIEVKPSPLRFIGRLFKKKFTGPAPFGKNSPTAPEIRITDKREFDSEKQNFMRAFEKICKGESAVKRDSHPFFGKMTPHEWGIINYKHLDHHFRQFGI
jgi:hypothetical protein